MFAIDLWLLASYRPVPADLPELLHQPQQRLLKNVSAAQVTAFRNRTALVSLLGVVDETRILEAIAAAHASPAQPAENTPISAPTVPTVRATEPRRLVADPRGYFVIYPDARRHRLVVEHYTNHGVLAHIIEAATPAAAYGEIVARELISRLDHAAYLGRELARAEASLRTGERHVQDRAAGEIEVETQNACGCSTPCGGSTRSDGLALDSSSWRSRRFWR